VSYVPKTFIGSFNKMSQGEKRTKKEEGIDGTLVNEESADFLGGHEAGKDFPTLLLPCPF
ncbi:MAG: hypothetical protein RR419_08675, partial [Akkermansia sp.]